MHLHIASLRRFAVMNQEEPIGIFSNEVKVYCQAGYG